MDDFRHVGCIVTRLKFERWEPYDVHHLLSGNRRRGHLFTIPLSPFYHRGIVPAGYANYENAAAALGPSFAKEPRAFRYTFGTDDELLEATNLAIAAAVATLNVRSA
jgi:hypothetical protein